MKETTNIQHGSFPAPVSKVFHCDCMEYMRSLPDKFFSLAIVDPPYGLGKKSMTGCGKLKNRILNQSEMWKWDVAPDSDYFEELFRVSCNQIIWGGNYFKLPPTRCFVCWDKQQPWENFSQCELAWTSFDKPAKLVTLSKSLKEDKMCIHPTQKPISLYAYLLKTFARPGDSILDTHLGSGSSRIAAYGLGFDFYSTEIDATFFNSQEERFRRYFCGEFFDRGGDMVVQRNLFFE